MSVSETIALMVHCRHEGVSIKVIDRVLDGSLSVEVEYFGGIEIEIPHPRDCCDTHYKEDLKELTNALTEVLYETGFINRQKEM